MPLRAAVREIKEKRFAPVYLLYGTESFLMEEFIAFARNAMIAPDYADLNVSVYDCQETQLAAILQDAETFPFLADQRVVIAQNAFFLTGAKPPTKVEVEPEALLHYLDEPPTYTSLFITVDADKLDERKKLVKTLQQKAVTIPFQPLRDTELYAWIERRAQKYKRVIKRDEAILLVEYAGSNLRLLDKEIEKMSLYVNEEEGIIHRDVIRMLASRTLEQDVFALIEAVVSGTLSEAFRILYDMTKMGEEPIKLLALFARQIRMLLHVKTWAPRGYSQQQLATMLKVHPFAIKKAMEQSKHFEEEGLRRLLHQLAEEDYRMKSGQVNKQLAIELFITRVAQEKKNP
ncbi:DNA polymerase III subunit delta [Brevibacillus sp. SYSU BS000544]|uniref:DNA polymerase III subunit delta n=1 Tax=Brevibacillus sp. SYSU BS000544 TaxID=3416443 RepID=UPI003CE50E20